MGILDRNPSAPYRSGEELDGTSDLEADISAFVAEFNGKISDVNIASVPTLRGTQVGSTVLTSNKFENHTITTAHMTTAAHMKMDSTADFLTDSATFVDVPTIASITVTPEASTDLIVATFSTAIDAVTSSTESSWLFSFDVDGSPLEALYLYEAPDGGASTSQFTYTWSWEAGSSGSGIIVKPIYLRRLGSGDIYKFLNQDGTGGGFVNKVFTVHRISS